MIIYKITNNIDGKSYIGQTVRTFNERYRGNWPKYTHNSHLFNSVQKHGLINFKVEFLEQNVESQEKLDELEVYYIKIFNTLEPNGYNHSTGGSNGRLSQNTKDNIAISRHKGKIFQLKNQQTGEIVEFINIKRFCKENNAPSSVRRVLTGKIKMGGYWTLPETVMDKYEVLSPDKKSYSIVDGCISDFCQQHNLKLSGFHRMLCGEYTYYKGWSLPKNMIDERDYLYKIVSPDGKEISIKKREIKLFCKEYNLPVQSIRYVLSGGKKECNGWKLPETILKTYSFISPHNEVLCLFKYQLPEFRLKNNLSLTTMRNLLSGSLKSHKGWRAASKGIDLSQRLENAPE